MNQEQKSIWKVILFNIEEEGKIHQISEKPGKHLESIKNLYFTVTPASDVKQDVMEVGELSLLFNNSKVHAVHLTTSFSAELLSEAFEPFTLNQPLDKSQGITGYYRDYSTLKNEFGEFITYQVKILLECIIIKES